MARLSNVIYMIIKLNETMKLNVKIFSKNTISALRHSRCFTSQSIGLMTLKLARRGLAHGQTFPLRLCKVPNPSEDL